MLSSCLLLGELLTPYNTVGLFLCLLGIAQYHRIKTQDHAAAVVAAAVANAQADAASVDENDADANTPAGRGLASQPGLDKASSRGRLLDEYAGEATEQEENRAVSGDTELIRRAARQAGLQTIEASPVITGDQDSGVSVRSGEDGDSEPTETARLTPLRGRRDCRHPSP